MSAHHLPQTVPPGCSGCVGFEPHGAEVVSCGQVHVGVHGGGQEAQQGDGGLGAAFYALEFGRAAYTSSTRRILPLTPGQITDWQCRCCRGVSDCVKAVAASSRQLAMSLMIGGHGAEARN